MSDLPPPTGAPVELVTPASGTPKVIVWAFILSLAGFLILTALAALAMVLANWKKVDAAGKGKGLALAALVISGFWLLIMVLALLSPSDNAAISTGTAGIEVIEDATEPEPAEPEPTIGLPEPVKPTLDQIESCIVAWSAEKKAFDAGILDDATLRATAFDCPDYETWERMRSEVGYRNTSPNLLRALCALEATSPVCKDANR